VRNNPVNLRDPSGEEPVIVTVAGGILIIGTIAGAVSGAIQARIDGESIAVGAFRGSLQGFAGSLAGVLVGTHNPLAIGLAVGTASDLAGQAFDKLTSGKSFSFGQLAFDIGSAALTAGAVSKAIRLPGPEPALFRPRAIWDLAQLNAQRLFQQETLATALDFLFSRLHLPSPMWRSHACGK